MSTTLEDLYRNPGDFGPHPDYDAARKAKVYEIAAYLEGRIHPMCSAASIASRIMDKAEEMGTIYGDTVSGEVPRSWTCDGNPLPVSI